MNVMAHRLPDQLPDCAACPLRESTWCGAYFTNQQKDFDRLHRNDEHIRARRPISRAGSVSQRLFTLREGWAMSYSILKDGQRQILEIFVPGDVIGLKTMLGKSLAVSVAAITDVVLCGFVMSDIVIHGLRSPIVAAEFIRQLSEQLSALENRLIDVGRRSAAPRIASFILRLRAKLAQRGLVNDSGFQFPLRQSHIADALGLTTVHVNRMLGMFRAEGLLSFNRGQLTILQLERLVEIAESTDD